MEKPPLVPLPLDDEAPDRLVDEIHVHENREILDRLEPTMSKRIMIARAETPDGRRVTRVDPCPRPKRKRRARKAREE